MALKDKLRKGTLTVKEAENLLDDKFDAMKDINCWNEEAGKHVLVLQQPQVKKTFKEKCTNCGIYGDKAADC